MTHGYEWFIEYELIELIEDFAYEGDYEQDILGGIDDFLDVVEDYEVYWQ